MFSPKQDKPDFLKKLRNFFGTIFDAEQNCELFFRNYPSVQRMFKCSLMQA